MQEMFLHRSTRRIPVNIPYLVDNLWEWLRPEGFPSRRYSAFASPTPRQAHSGVSAASDHPEDFIMTEVEILGDAIIAQVSENDAKDHPDVRKLLKEFYSIFGLGWVEQPIETRLELSPLFLPVISKDEVDQVLHSINDGNELCEMLIKASTFWQDVKIVKLTDERLLYSDGEIFFEAYDGYRLKRISYKHSI
jgi:hypothetical protein